MKQNNIVKAYNIINTLYTKSMNVKTSLAFYKVRQALQPQYDFQLEQERNIIKETHPTQKENGNLKFENDELQKEFMNKLSELSNLDVDLEFDKVFIDDDTLSLSIEEIEVLSPFIEFE